MKRLK